MLPEIEIDVLLDETCAPVLRGHPLVNRVIEAPKGRGKIGKFTARLKTIRELRSRRYDLAVSLHGGPTSMILTRLSGARSTAGFAHHPAAWLMNLRAPHPSVIWDRENIHTVEGQLSILKWLGVPMPSPPPPTSLAIDPDSDSAVRSILQEHDLNGPFAIIHPCAGWESKQWRLEGFTEVIAYLREEHNLPSLVIGTPADYPIISRIISRAPATGLTDLLLAQTIALISLASIFIGNDSGPAHIAAAFDIPQVVIYEKAEFASTWAPWTNAPNQSIIAEIKSDDLCPITRCSPCRFPGCIRQVTVEQVIEAVDEVFCSAAEINACRPDRIGTS